MANERRSFKNLLVSPERQIRFAAIFLALTVGVHAAASTVMYLLYKKWHAVGPLPWSKMMAVMVVVYAFIFGYTFLLGLVMSHRIYGPLNLFDRHFRALKRGDFSGKIVLRKEDDLRLKQLAESVNSLTAQLRTRP